MFKVISEFPNYSVSNEGVVINNKTGRELKQFIRQSRSTAYKQVFLYNADGRKSVLVHRLVAQAFIPNPYNLPQVNHIDENPLNNSVDNLEWCTAKYNCNYGHHTENVIESLKNSDKSWRGRKHTRLSRHRMSVAKLGKPSLRKKAVIIDGHIEVDSLTECAEYLGISLTQVYNVINGLRKSTEYTIQYKEANLCTNE